MKKILTIITILILSNSISWSQNINEKDSLEIMREVDKLFKLFENPNFTQFEKMSTEKIYCLFCFYRPIFEGEPYMIDRRDFFDNHLEKIKKSDDFNRLRISKNIMLLNEYDYRTDISVFYTIYQKDELAPGHEGGQFGIYFKKVNGELKFSGMETIP